MRKLSKKPVPLSEVLNKLIFNLGIEKGILQGQAFTLWDEVVGGINAKKAKPIKIDRGKLLVRTTDSTWRQELFYQKNEIIRKLNIRLRSDVVKDIIFL